MWGSPTGLEEPAKVLADASTTDVVHENADGNVIVPAEECADAYPPDPA